MTKIIEKICWILFAIACGIAITSSMGCALLRLPENVQSISDNVKQVKNDLASVANQTVTDPLEKAKMLQGRERLDQEKKDRDQKDQDWMTWLLGLCASIGTGGNLSIAALLLAAIKWFQQWQERKKKEAAYDAADLALAKVPEYDKEQVKMAMRVSAVSNGVHKSIKKDLADRRKK